MKKLDLQIGNYSLAAFVDGNDANSMVAVKPLCEALGVASWKQMQKLQDNPQFSCQPMLSTGTDGKKYEMLCIPLKQVGMWLCGINANRVKPGTREKLIAFQQELQFVIYEAIRGTTSPGIIQQLKNTVDMLRKQLGLQQQRIEALEQHVDVLSEKQSYCEDSRRVQGEHMEIYRSHVASEAGRSLALQKRLQH